MNVTRTLFVDAKNALLDAARTIKVRRKTERQVETSVQPYEVAPRMSSAESTEGGIPVSQRKAEQPSLGLKIRFVLGTAFWNGQEFADDELRQHMINSLVDALTGFDEGEKARPGKRESQDAAKVREAFALLNNAQVKNSLYLCVDKSKSEAQYALGYNREPMRLPDSISKKLEEAFVAYCTEKSLTYHLQKNNTAGDF